MSFSRYLALILFTLLILGSVAAEPGIPHKFYGSVTVNGAPADGANIVAKINNVEMASTFSINGNYGFIPSIFHALDPQGNNNGETIEFFLNGKPVNESPVIFKNGASTQLNLSIGVAPYCGDGTCNAGETCETCSGDCGSCGGGGGSLGGGSSSNQLSIEIEGACIGQEIEVTVLNTVGNPAKDATVKVLKDRKSVAEEKTGEDGIVSFTFEEEGDYTFYVTKNLYTQSSKTISLAECKEGQEPEPGTGKGDEGKGENLCLKVDCDDANPCTQELCINATGHCSYQNIADGMACSPEGKCMDGVCEEPVQEPAGQMGFFGLSTGQLGWASLLIAALIAVAAYLLAAGKRKKKK